MTDLGEIRKLIKQLERQRAKTDELLAVCALRLEQMSQEIAVLRYSKTMEDYRTGALERRKQNIAEIEKCKQGC